MIRFISRTSEVFFTYHPPYSKISLHCDPTLQQPPSLTLVSTGRALLHQGSSPPPSILHPRLYIEFYKPPALHRITAPSALLVPFASTA